MATKRGTTTTYVVTFFLEHFYFWYWCFSFVHPVTHKMQIDVRFVGYNVTPRYIIQLNFQKLISYSHPNEGESWWCIWMQVHLVQSKMINDKNNFLKQKYFFKPKNPNLFIDTISRQNCNCANFLPKSVKTHFPAKTHFLAKTHFSPEPRKDSSPKIVKHKFLPKL